MRIISLVTKGTVFLLFLGIFFYFASSTNIALAGTGDACAVSADCNPPINQTCFCQTQCSGTVTGYCVSPNGTCACTTSTSTHCPPGAWSGWSACVNGYQWRACSTYGNDIQIQACTVTGGGGGGGGNSTPPPVITPSCTVSVTPSSSNLDPGSTVTLTAAVTANSAVDQVNWVSSAPSVASVSPASDATSPYRTVVTAGSLGNATITARVIMNGVSTCTSTASIQVRLGAWWQIKDSDLSAIGSLNSLIPTGSYFGLPGTGGYPGVPAYGVSTNLNVTNASQVGWLAQTSATNPKVFDSQYFNNQIPADTIIQTLGNNVLSQTVINANTTPSHGYYWYKYDGATSGLDLQLDTALTLGTRKVILLVNNANFNVNSTINLQDGNGFLLVIVGKNSSGAKGDISVNPAVGGTAYDMEGLYIADSEFNSGAGTSSLHVRGSVVAYDGVNLDRDLGLGNASPSELFEYAPDQILLFPSVLGTRKLNWKEVAP